jgi:hypothetical protein
MVVHVIKSRADQLRQHFLRDVGFNMTVHSPAHLIRQANQRACQANPERLGTDLADAAGLEVSGMGGLPREHDDAEDRRSRWYGSERLLAEIPYQSRYQSYDKYQNRRLEFVRLPC